MTHGVNVYLRDRAGAERKIAVWYAREYLEQEVSPREAVNAYLDDANPPEHLVVTDGGVSVMDTE